MIRLFHFPQTTSDRIRWLLAELQIPYEPVLVDLMAGEHKKPDYLKINPNGLVPTLADGDTVLFESAAIILYLVEKYGGGKLAPSMGSADRAAFYQWIAFTATSVDPPAFQVLLHDVLLPPDRRNRAASDENRGKFDAAATVLERALGGKPYLVGGAFSAADVMAGGALYRAIALGLLSDRPALLGYVNEITQRPAAPYGNVKSDS